LTELEKAYPGKVRVAWKKLSAFLHNNAKPAAEAAMAANEQGKFWEMHDILFKTSRTWMRASLEKYAKEIGLDMTKFKAAIDSHKFAAQIEADTKQGSSLGVQGTPASFLNGHLSTAPSRSMPSRRSPTTNWPRAARARRRSPRQSSS